MTDDLFTYAAEQAAAAGIESSALTAGEEWARQADAFIDTYARRNPTVFVDDLWDAGLPEPESPRALGARMRAASRRGIIRKTDRVRPSVRSNLSGKPIWVSLIYQEDTP